MSYYAKINSDNIVEQVIVAEQDFIDTQEGRWIQTSYNTHNNHHRRGGTPLRGNFASPGYIYDDEHDVFYCAQPFPSWRLNTNSWSWQAPIPYPDDENSYSWDEQNLTWIKL